MSDPGRWFAEWRIAAIWLWGGFAFFSCANKVAPAGGEKDLSPPKMVSSSPGNYSTDFSDNEIIIEFDEFIQLKDLNKQLIISPPLEPMPVIAVKKKSVHISLGSPLKENTTYTFNFGSSIADVREGNPSENFQFIFSTGPSLDSMFVAGNAVVAENLKSEAGVLVMLYRASEDSVPLKQLPGYFAKTDASGNFRINYVAAGDYKIFALKDKNNNYLFDLPDEEIAFVSGTISSEDSISHSLKLFRNPLNKLRIKSAAIEQPGKVKIIFNEHAQGLSMKAIHPSANPWEQEEFSAHRDTVILWFADTTLDSLKVAFYQNEIPFDTARFYFSRKTGKGAAGAGKLQVISNLSGGFLEQNMPLQFGLSAPAKSYLADKIILTTDSVATEIPEFQFTDSVRRIFQIRHAWKEKKNYRIDFLPGAFESIFGIKNDTSVFSFVVRPATEYGTLLLKINPGGADNNYVIQLVNIQEMILREKNIQLPESIHFEFLPPGTYRLKAIDDENKNNQWDTGNYFESRQPENVFYYPENITVRANWDLEIEWDFKK